MRHPLFRRWWLGAFVSFVGSWIQMVAHGWLVYDLTVREGLPDLVELRLGLVGFANALPMLFLGPFGGTLADRFERKRILTVTQCLFALSTFTLSLLTLTGYVQFYHILALGFLNGCVGSVDGPTRLSMVSDLVSKEDLANGIALNAASFQTARILGPAIGGLLLAWKGPGICFLINGFSYLAILTMLISLPPLPRPAHEENHSTWQSFLEGFRFLYHHRALRTLVLNVMVVTSFGLSYSTLMPVFAVDILNIGKTGLGELYSAAGIGSLLGLLGLARLSQSEKHGWMVLVAAHGFGLGVMAFGASEDAWLSKAILLGIGMMAVLELANTNTVLQTHAPDHLRGRIVSFHVWAMNGPAPFGALLTGFVATHLGAPHAVLISGAICTFFALLMFVFVPEVRRLR